MKSAFVMTVMFVDENLTEISDSLSLFWIILFTTAFISCLLTIIQSSLFIHAREGDTLYIEDLEPQHKDTKLDK